MTWTTPTGPARSACRPGGRRRRPRTPVAPRAISCVGSPDRDVIVAAAIRRVERAHHRLEHREKHCVNRAVPAQPSSRLMPSSFSTCFSYTGSELPLFILKRKYFS